MAQRLYYLANQYIHKAFFQWINSYSYPYFTCSSNCLPSVDEACGTGLQCTATSVQSELRYAIPADFPEVPPGDVDSMWNQLVGHVNGIQRFLPNITEEGVYIIIWYKIFFAINSMTFDNFFVSCCASELALTAWIKPFSFLARFSEVGLPLPDS